MKMYLVYSVIAMLFMFGCSNTKEENKIETHVPKKHLDKKVSIAGLEWYTDVDSGFNRAQKEHKNVIIMVGEDSCRWCTKMKEGTLTDKRIQKVLKDYILVSIKRSDKEAVKVVPEFDGNIPSFFFMNEKKETIEPVVGYFKADDFLTYIKEIGES